MKNTNFILKIVAIIAFVESYYIYSEPIPRKGLNFLYIVPLIFALCILIFGKKIVPYHKYGLGLKIYYFIVIIRYVVQPFLIVISHGKLNFRMPEASASTYPVAILIYGIELVIACVVIQKWFPIYVKKYQKKEKIEKEIVLNIYGKGILIVYFLFLFIRSSSWIPGMNILGIKESTSDIAVVFDATIFNCLKVFIFIFFIIKAKKNSKNKNRFTTYFLIAIIAGLFNFLTFFGSNRSFIYETAIATIAIFIYSFPQFKKSLSLVLLPFAIVLMFGTYVTKQFGTDNGTTLATENTQTVASNIVEEYSNGLWTVAKSYQSSIGLSANTSAEAFAKDISDGLSGLSDLPGFKTINKGLTNLRSSSDIFKNSLKQEDDRGQMLSLSGGFLIIGGELFGWIILFLGNYLMIMQLVKMEAASKTTNDLYYRYMYIWMSILMGLVHCYCLQTIIFCWSKFILFYWIVLYFNKMGLQKKKYTTFSAYPNFSN